MAQHVDRYIKMLFCILEEGYNVVVIRCWNPVLNRKLVVDFSVQDPMDLIPPAVVQQQTVVLCLPIDLKEGYNNCNEALQLMNSPSLGISFRCLGGGSVKGCVQMLRDGVAQIAKVPGSGAVLGEDSDGMLPLVMEYVNADLGNSTLGYTVALVDSDWCYSDHGGNPSVADVVKEKERACFSGYATESWFASVGYLMRQGQIDIVSNETDVSDDAESVLHHFDKICAPGYYPLAPKEGGGKYGDMCKLCGGSCKETSSWYGAKGALKCGKEKGDVIFMEYPLKQDDKDEEDDPPEKEQAASEQSPDMQSPVSSPDVGSPDGDEFAYDYDYEYAYTPDPSPGGVSVGRRKTLGVRGFSLVCFSF